MKPLVRFSVFLLLLHAVLKIYEANCDSSQCAENQTETLTTTTTTVRLESDQNCNLSIGNDTTGQGSITDLTPGKVYKVFFICFNCCKEVTMKPEAVRNLHVTNVTTNSLTVNWTEPEGNSSLYRVNWTNGQVNTTETSQTIKDLTAGVLYCVSVTAVASDDRTEGQNSTVCRYTLPEVVEKLTVVNVTTSSISLEWTKPKGESSFYRVQWTDGTTNNNKNVTETKINVTDLTAGVLYDFTVIAVAGDNTTESEMAETFHYTIPEVVEKLTVVYVTTSSISLEWTKPKGESSFYRVQWTDGTTNNNKNVTETRINVTDLTAGVRYDFTVIAVAGDNTTESEMAETFHYTKPNIIQNLTVTELTTSSMYVTWSKPEGGSSFYRVQWTNEGKDETLNVTETHINITNLTAGVQYEISVIAVAEDHITEGNSTMVSHYTSKCVMLSGCESVLNNNNNLYFIDPTRGHLFFTLCLVNMRHKHRPKYTHMHKQDLMDIY
ncbi:receptor-type tyrosine-protein phosphatase eta [Labrus bergylta]|uniref:receptor-type tyrosine-protein phosphatase eta n=1 Tax=Labrus bergylta TaxID=56723 RepID=UPI0033136BCD